jgi:hypothetical protein
VKSAALGGVEIRRQGSILEMKGSTCEEKFSSIYIREACSFKFGGLRWAALDEGAVPGDNWIGVSLPAVVRSEKGAFAVRDGSGLAGLVGADGKVISHRDAEITEGIIFVTLSVSSVPL